MKAELLLLSLPVYESRIYIRLTTFPIYEGARMIS